MEALWFSDSSLQLCAALALLILWQCWSWRRGHAKERSERGERSELLKADLGQRPNPEHHLQARLQCLEQELQSTKLRALEAEAKLDVQQKDLQRLRKQREEEMQNCSHSMDLEAVKLQEVMCLNLELQARVQALEAELRTRPSRTLKPDVHQVDCEVRPLAADGDQTPKHKGYVGVNEDQTATGQGNKIIPTLGDQTPKHKGYVGVNEDQAATGQGNKTIPTLGLGKVREVFYAQDISREDALALQSDLMLAFNAPAFQRQLHDFARQFEKGSAGFRKALLPLVRSVQLVVIPRYGFEKSEAGVEAMLRSFKSLQNDLDIQVNNLAIQDLLNPWTEQQLTNVAPLVHRRPSTKFRVLDLLQAMLKEFGKASFQRDIGELKKAANFNSRRVFDFSQASINFEDPEGYFELEGREDLALIVQQAILPGFGFEASKEGVKEMMRHCAPFFQDPEVADLLDAINSKLGMSASACKRFRALWARSDAK